MATIAEQLTSLANTKAAIKQSIIDKGVQVADTDPFSAYPAKIGQISGGSAPATKYGVSIDNLLGNVDENGVYQLSDAPFTFDATSIKEFSDIPGQLYVGYDDIFAYKFYRANLVGTVDFSNFVKGSSNSTIGYYFENTFSNTRVQKFITPKQRTGIGNVSFYKSFNDCLSLKEIVFSNPIIAGNTFGFYHTFWRCDFSDASINFDIITSVGQNGLYGAFQYCKLQEEINFTNLTEITSNYGLRTAFGNSSGCKRYFFPSLVSLVSNSFGGSSSTLTWYNATDVEEIHFRADMQATIEAQYGYSSKFGAPSTCTIFFDLIGTITVNGVAYSRNEPNSIRVDGTNTFVAWKDASNNIVYTNATAEPAVNTPVYSDAGTTQVGTVSEVA